MRFFRGYGKLIGLGGISFLCLIGLFCGTIEENMLALVPQSIKRQAQLFERSPLSQKLIVIVTSASSTQTSQLSQEVRDRLIQAGFVKPQGYSTGNVIQDTLMALPARFSAQVQQITEQKLSAEAIATQLADYYENDSNTKR